DPGWQLPEARLGSRTSAANRTTVMPHRTPPLLLLLLAALALGAASAHAGNGVPTLVFPVVGQVQYTDDFGQPRPGGPHQGNDLMAAKRAPAVAAEAGKVKYWTKSAAAGCMLYLYGQSGTTYYYIHLNNDKTLKNDNRGKCVRGTADAGKNGARGAAGQQSGYDGAPGAAARVQRHQHVAVHPNAGTGTHHQAT